MSGAGLRRLEPGALFGGDFEVVRQLGEGGMGAVYVALQRSTGRHRALKVMLPKLVAEPTLRARFEREARVAATVDSPHVVEVLAAGVDAATDTPWIAMELLLGEDLGARLARGPIPLPEALGVLRAAALALAAAHRVGVVHRDLKPENVFLDTSRVGANEPYRVKVLDFGVALIRQHAADPSMTQAVGSPLWMAPEQAELGDRIGPQADVWSLGLLAFAVLTGRSYWRAGSDPTATIPALMRELLFDPLVSASERAKRFGLPPLPAGFDAWFERAVVRDPAQRFRDASEALEMLAVALTAAPIKATRGAPPTLLWSPPTAVAPRLPGTAPAALPPSPAPPRARGERRPPLTVGALALVALAASGLAWARSYRRAAPRVAAVSPAAAPAPAPAPVVTPAEDAPLPGTRPPTAMRALDLPSRAVQVQYPPETPAPRPRRAAPARAAAQAAPPDASVDPTPTRDARERTIDALRRTLDTVASEEDKQRILRQLDALRAS